MERITVTELLDEIRNGICNDYCKYPEICSAEEKDPKKAEDLLYETCCRKCPLNKL